MGRRAPPTASEGVCESRITVNIREDKTVARVIGPERLTRVSLGRKIQSSPSVYLKGRYKRRTRSPVQSRSSAQISTISFNRRPSLQLFIGILLEWSTRKSHGILVSIAGKNRIDRFINIAAICVSLRSSVKCILSDGKKVRNQACKV